MGKMAVYAVFLLLSCTGEKMNDNIIPFDSRERLLATARAYIFEPDRIPSELHEAIPLLLKALKIADEDLKLKIVLILGTFAHSQVVRPLFNLMHDVNESESIRYTAAVQLSILGELWEDSEVLIRELKNDLLHEDPFVRANAVLALGWEHNRHALPELIECLADRDPDVQQAAVNALTNMRSERLLGLLIERLDICGKDQKQCILYALNRFHSHKEQVVAVYEQYLQDEDPDLRYTALLSCDLSDNGAQHLYLVARALQDPEARIRKLALHRLMTLPEKHVAWIESQVRPLMDDPEPPVRQAAVKLFHSMHPKPTRAY